MYLSVLPSTNWFHPKQIPCGQSLSAQKEYFASLRIMKLVSPYFLSRYRNGSQLDIQKRRINGVWHTVERFNHGLAHGLRQGALAKDIVDILYRARPQITHLGIDGFLEWIRQKHAEGTSFSAKLEMAASFQRSGRQSDVSSSADPTLYKQYEWQDTINFQKAAKSSKIFRDDREIELFKEAILWSNRGNLDENDLPDLKYLRCILHAAHTLDLRRIPAFDAAKIKNDCIDQLFDNQTDRLPLALSRQLADLLFQRSGEYLKATGDRDLVSGRLLTDDFFIQTRNPVLMGESGSSHSINSALYKSCEM